MAPTGAGPTTITLAALAERAVGEPAAALALAGAKAFWLARARADRTLAELGVVVPDGFVIPAGAEELLLDGTRDPMPGSATVAAQAEVQAALTDLLADGSALAVRSSASVEDGPAASFAGEFVSVLDVTTAGSALAAYRTVLASLHSPAAAKAYEHLGLDPGSVTMAVLVQRMVGAEGSIGGVLLSSFEHGGEHGTLVEAAPGGARAVVAGRTDPTALLLTSSGSSVLGHGPGPGGLPLSETLLSTLARLAAAGEELVGSAVEIEWLWEPRRTVVHLLQLRPLVPPPSFAPAARTVPRVVGGAPGPAAPRTGPAAGPTVLTSGMAVGQGSVSGPALVTDSPTRALEALADDRYRDGYVLVVPETAPEWLPLIRGALAVVTDVGGRTSHAAIVCRELGIPALVGCGDATLRLRDVVGPVTVLIAGDGAGSVSVQSTTV